MMPTILHNVHASTKSAYCTSLGVIILCFMCVFGASRDGDDVPWWDIAPEDQVELHVRRSSRHRHALPFGHTSTSIDRSKFPNMSVVAIELQPLYVEIKQSFASSEEALYFLFPPRFLESSATRLEPPSDVRAPPSWAPKLEGSSVCTRHALSNSTIDSSGVLMAARRIIWAALAAVEDHYSGRFSQCPAARAAAVVDVAWIQSVPIAYSSDFARGPTALFKADGKAVVAPIGYVQSAQFTLQTNRDHNTVDEVFEVRQFVQYSTRIRSLLSLHAAPLPPQRSVFREASAEAIRVLSYNIWNYNGNWDARCRDIVELIRDVAPTVLLLQEVRIDTGVRSGVRVAGSTTSSALPAMADTAGHSTVTSPERYRRHSANQAEHLMRGIRTAALPLWFDFHPAMTYAAGERVRRFQMEGPLIAHRHVTLATVPVFLSRVPASLREAGDDHQRVLLCTAVGVSVPHGGLPSLLRVDLCTTHFSLTPRAQLRNAVDSARAIAALAHQSIHGLKAAHTIFTGDLNAEPHHAAIRLLATGNATLRVPRFVDAYESFRACGEGVCAEGCRHEAETSQLGPHGYTFNNLDRNLTKRIDFLFVRTWDEGRGSTLCLRRFSYRGRMDPQTTRAAASDHLALVADFDIRRT